MSPKESKKTEDSKIFDGTHASSNAWFRRIRTKIEGNSLGEYIHGSSLFDDIETTNLTKKKEWKAGNAKALSIILESLGRHADQQPTTRLECTTNTEQIEKHVWCKQLGRRRRCKRQV